jgi:hypothetical protein
MAFENLQTLLYTLMLKIALGWSESKVIKPPQLSPCKIVTSQIGKPHAPPKSKMLECP